MENINTVDLPKDQVNIINQHLVDPLFIINLLTKKLITNDKLDKKTQDEIKLIAKQSKKIHEYISGLSKNIES